MEFYEIVEQCAILGIDLCLLGLSYKLYKGESYRLKTLQSAQCFELNNELVQKIADSGGEIPYAVVTGKVRALSTPLQSEHLSSVRGVIREKVVKEYKATWIPFLRMWSTTDCNVEHNCSYVPFGLFSHSSFLKKPVVVEVVDPWLGQKMEFAKVVDEFKAHEGSFKDAVLSLILREHTVGTQEMENMLLENTRLTAVGKLISEKNSLKITPPDDSLAYYVTPYTYDVLIQKIRTQTQVYKGLTILMCALTGVMIAFIVKKGYAEVKRRIHVARDLKRRQEARMAARESSSEPAHKCVVCLENPVEVVVLECGHACLCLNCSEQRINLCPICRGDVNRLVPVYMP